MGTGGRRVSVVELWESMNDRFFGGFLDKPAFRFDDLGPAQAYYHPEHNLIEFDRKYAEGAMLVEVIDTLAHEMVHQLQSKTGREVCHDGFFEWKMKSILG